MNAQRRVVLCVAAGLALAVLAAAVSRLLTAPGDGGWFMYAPGSEAAYTSSRDGDVLKAGSVWLAAIGVWVLVSWRLFRPPER
ncbi:MAG: hypothetical protein ACK5OX_17415 [Desertimonas sp.]